MHDEDALPLTGTFLDEISHDIPHQNWGPAEWESDFQAMRTIGIDTVVLIRCGYRRWMTFPSKVLAEKHGMAFYLGTYDSGRYWQQGDFAREIDLNVAVADEAWARYGARPAFRGWYLSQEVSRRTRGITELYARMGRHCKAISGNLPTLISPWIDGIKSVSSFGAAITRTESITLEEHEREWNAIMEGIRGAVDIVAFQDGHVELDELADYLALNRRLAERHGLRCWTNAETFDRDMPIKFLPIKWEKLLVKLGAARRAGLEKAITFEFSHFLSPNSAYPQAGRLYERYTEHFGL